MRVLTLKELQEVAGGQKPPFGAKAQGNGPKGPSNNKKPQGTPAAPPASPGSLGSPGSV